MIFFVYIVTHLIIHNHFFIQPRKSFKKIETKIDFDISPMFEKLLSTNTSKWMNLYKHTMRQSDSKDHWLTKNLWLRFASVWLTKVGNQNNQFLDIFWFLTPIHFYTKHYVVTMYLNYYFDFGVCVSVCPCVRVSFCKKNFNI